MRSLLLLLRAVLHLLAMWARADRRGHHELGMSHMSYGDREVVAMPSTAAAAAALRRRSLKDKGKQIVPHSPDDGLSPARDPANGAGPSLVSLCGADMEWRGRVCTVNGLGRTFIDTCFKPLFYTEHGELRMDWLQHDAYGACPFGSVCVQDPVVGGARDTITCEPLGVRYRADVTLDGRQYGYRTIHQPETDNEMTTYDLVITVFRDIGLGQISAYILQPFDGIIEEDRPPLEPTVEVVYFEGLDASTLATLEAKPQHTPWRPRPRRRPAGRTDLDEALALCVAARLEEDQQRHALGANLVANSWLDIGFDIVPPPHLQIAGQCRPTRWSAFRRGAEIRFRFRIRPTRFVQLFWYGISCKNCREP